ncbi:Alpha/Beta hydrolase protein, partial [Piptocephalis cylindrospora]
NVPVILVHGFYGSRHNWDIFPQIIADHARSVVHALDMRNHGESEDSSEMHYAELAMDIDRYMQDRGMTKAVLVGHSMGAKAAMTMALHPNPQVQGRVHSLVILDTPPRPIFVPENFHNCDLATRLIEQNDIRSIPEMDKALGIIFPDQYLRDYFIQSCKSSPTTGTLTTGINANVMSSSFEELADFPYPRLPYKEFYGKVTFMVGTSSAIMRAQDEKLFSMFFPRSKTVSLEGGHWVHCQHPKTFISLVSDACKIDTRMARL